MKHPNKSVVKIYQNVKKTPRDRRRLVVIQTPLKDFYLELVRKTHLEFNNNNNNMEVPVV